MRNRTAVLTVGTVARSPWPGRAPSAAVAQSTGVDRQAYLRAGLCWRADWLNASRPTLPRRVSAEPSIGVRCRGLGSSARLSMYHATSAREIAFIANRQLVLH